MYKKLLKNFLILIIVYNLKLHQINIKTIYLIGKLNKENEIIYYSKHFVKDIFAL